jgi:hypothetical protein
MVVPTATIGPAGHFRLCDGVQCSVLRTSKPDFANMMRVRGAIVLAAGVPFWIYLVRFTNEVRKSPFGSEFGSVASTPPPQFRAAQLVVVISFFLGLSLLMADFINWIKKRANDHPR